MKNDNRSFSQSRTEQFCDRRITRKMLGDAGEHYVLAQLMFCGTPCSKMPDGWEHYDLVADTGSAIERISV